MLRLDKEQRTMLAEIVSNIANIAAGALVFGQFFSGQRLSILLAAAGAAIWVVFVAWSLFLIKERPA